MRVRGPGRNDIENAPAQIIAADLGRPVAKAKIGGNSLRLEPDDVGIGTIAELVVAGVMIAMTVRVGDDEVDRSVVVPRPPVGNQPIDGRPDLEAAGTAVDKDGALFSEQQVEKGRPRSSSSRTGE